MVNLVEAGYMAIAFVVFVVAVSIGGAVLAGVQSTQFTTAVEPTCTLAKALAGQVNCTTVAFNATASGLTGVTNLATQSGTIGTILGAVIIIGLLMGAFLYSKKE
jgi:hypothetical protein